MVSKYVAFQEETVYGALGAGVFSTLKLFNETVVTSREDFYPETTQYWEPSNKLEGFFRTRGTVTMPVDPVVFPQLLVYFMGDPVSNKLAEAGAEDPYEHTFKFGANEVVAGSGLKSFTTDIGVGIEKDRRLFGCMGTKLSIEAISREQVTCSLDLVGNGNETLVDPGTPDYSTYTQPEFTFNSAYAMTVGGASRITQQPTIEAFRLDLERGVAEDYYPLGKRYVNAFLPSGVASVSGSMDFTFESEDEHERFLSAVGQFATGDQASFATALTFRGAQIYLTNYYTLLITIPKTYYTVSTPSTKARDRIVQTCDFKGIYDTGTSCAASIYVVNVTTGY